jgi:hypothetical protein
MALQELDEYDDDYVFLSDVETEQEPPSISATLSPAVHKGKQPLTTSSRPFSSYSQSAPAAAASSSTLPGSLPQEQLPQQLLHQQQPNSKRSSRVSNTSSVVTNGLAGRGEDGAEELESEPEEIEYGYDTDILLIMPSMLRNYSHHATNYHPELWRSPIPGSYPPPQSSARLRQEGT